MSDRTTYRRYASRRVPPVPADFVQQFVEGGWRRIEEAFGGNKNRHRVWIALAGGEIELKQRRREWRAANRRVG